jgi:hypothetical protein
MAVFLPSSTNADWHLISSNILSGGAHSSTNIGVRKVSATAMREDVSPELSVLFFPSNQVRVLLNHPTKTFVRQRGGAEHQHPALATNVITVRERAAFAGLPSEVHRWTNGSNSGSLWVTAAASFFPGAGESSSPFAPPARVSPSLAAGSLVDSNHLVIATEYTTLSPVWKPGFGTNPPTLLSNVTVTTRSILVSITETNFPPSVFEVPEDYKEVASLEPPPVKFDPAVFGNEPVGSNFTQSIRKRYEKSGSIFNNQMRIKPADFRRVRPEDPKPVENPKRETP